MSRKFDSSPAQKGFPTENTAQALRFQPQVNTSRSRHLPGKPTIPPQEAASKLFAAGKCAIEDWDVLEGMEVGWLG